MTSCEDIDINFSRLGSFWNTQLTDKSRKEARIVASLPLYWHGKTYIENIINNLSGNGNQKVTNYKLDLSNYNYTVIESPDTGYNLKINNLNEFDSITSVSYIDINNNTLVVKKDPNIELVKTSDGQNIKSITIVDLNINDVKDKIIFIDATYFLKSNKYSFILDNLLGLDNIPCDERIKYISNYIAGYNQSIDDFEVFLNVLLGCKLDTNGDYSKETPAYISITVNGNVATFSFNKTIENATKTIIKNVINKFIPIGYIAEIK